MLKNKIDDGFNPELVSGAFFDGLLEIPHIKRPDKIIIPSALIPFSQRNRSDNYKEFVHFYEHDKNFATVLTAAKEHFDCLKKFQGVISPDCSLYRDMPLVLQIANTYMNRAIGHYLQSKGLYVIPNIRWGDERSYTTIGLPEKFAFLGVPKHSIVSIGTYGCIKSKENKIYFTEGLEAMLDELEPEVVLVYGGMPDSIFTKVKDGTKFVHYPDWTSLQKRRSA